MPNTIILRGDNFTSREDKANTTITPGMMVDFAANDRLVPHASSGAYAPRMVALECDYIGNGVADNYASGDRVAYADCAAGTVFWGHLASGQNVGRGDILMSNGAGFLTARTSTNIGIAAADEDANASSGIGAGGSLRFRARII